MAKSGMDKKIRECTRVVNYWHKNSQDPNAEEAKAYFARALRSHLAYVKESGEQIRPEVLAAAERALQKA